MYITTGDLSESPNLERNFGIISTNVIAGTGLFSDIAASLTDVFGGSSESYKKQFDWITKTALEDLKSKSRAIGGNGIMGLRIDTNELSGKGKQMLMITVYGSAIKLRNDKKLSEAPEISQKRDVISVEEFVSFRKEKDRLENLKKQSLNDIFTREDIAECTSLHCIKIILDKLFDAKNTIPFDNNIHHINSWLRQINPEAIIDILNSYISSTARISPLVLDKFNLIFESVRISDYKLIEALLQKPDRSSRRLGLSLVSMTKLSYSRSDIDEYMNAIELINNMTPAEEYVKKSLTSSKMVWNCANEHIVDAEDDVCRECGLDKFGLKEGTIDMFIKELNMRIEHLNELLA